MAMLRYCISLSVLVFINVTLATVDPRTRCPTSLPRNNRLFAYNNVCIELLYTQHSWVGSRKYCQQHGGDLVVIQNMAKQTFIINALKQAHWDRNGIWIGGTDRDKEGEWKWITGERISWGFWRNGQGQRQHGFLFFKGTLEDCALIRLNDDYKWHDYPCFISQYSCICEYNMSQPIAPTTKRITTVTTSIPKSTTTLGVPTTTSMTTLKSTTSKPTTRMSTSTTHVPTTTTHAPITTTHAPTTTTYAPTTTTHAPITTTHAPATTHAPTTTTHAPTTTSRYTTTILPTSSTNTPITTSKSTTRIVPTSTTHVATTITHAPTTTTHAPTTTTHAPTSTTHVATTTSKPTTTRLVPKITSISTNKMRTPTTASQTVTSKAVQTASSKSTMTNVVTSPTTAKPKTTTSTRSTVKIIQAITTMKAETSGSTSQLMTNGQSPMSSKSKFVSDRTKHASHTSRGPTVKPLGQQGNPKNGKSYTGYIIGGSVAVVVLAGILIAVLVYKRRRDSKLRTAYSHDNPTYDMMHGKREAADITFKYGESLS